MHIALVVRAFDARVGGREAWVEGFARFLLARGDRVTVVSERNGSDLPVGFRPIAFTRWPMRRARAVAAALGDVNAEAVYDVGLGLRANVLHLHTGSEVESERRFVAASPFTLRARVALVPPTRWRWRQASLLEALQVRDCGRVVAVSTLAREQLERLYGKQGGRLVTVPNGVDAKAFGQPEPEAVARWRDQLATGGETLFLAVGHNHLLKGFDRALAALAALIRQGRMVRLAVAGGEADGFLAAQARALGIAQNFTFLGAVDSMAPLYAAADALVHPTRWDACSLATLEALAAGRPVVTTASNGAAERIVEGETGFVLDDGEDVSALAERMARLCDPALRTRMGRAAATSASAFSLSDNHRRIAGLLEEAAGERRVGS